MNKCSYERIFMTKKEVDSFVDKDRVKRVRKALVGERVFLNLAETFKAMGDPSRTKIIYALSLEELCVGDIAALLEISPSAVSHQLRILRNLKLVKFRREGQITYYSLDDDHIKNLFEEGLKHVAD